VQKQEDMFNPDSSDEEQKNGVMEVLDMYHKEGGDSET